MPDTQPLPAPWAQRLRASLPARRTYLRWLHLTMIPLVFWFVIATPDFVAWLWGSRGNAINSDIALVFVILCLVWSTDYFIRGLAGRAGPKLSPRLKRFHKVLHRLLIYGIMLIPVGGFFLGLTSERLLKAGGFWPIAPPMGWKHANELVGTFHIYQFYTLCGLAVIHAGFHIWRHVKLKDNALRIMAPKWLHRFL